ncbi:MAG TPA: tail fiber domain-containing protein [Pyrinomonadaceae bacterium]|nr:tail fiber domain-containing protein [Pyrinomonadaceae bacterium]
MTTIKRSGLAFCLLLSLVIVCGAQEQQPAPTIEVAPGPERVTFSAGRETQQARVQVFAPSGELVFDSGTVFGQEVAWDMRGRNGRRVPEGVYLATVSATDAAGDIHRRTEQVIVTSGARAVSTQAAAAPAPAPDAPTATGTGTVGKVAKFTAATELGDSIMTENNGKIGVNISPPTARMHVHAPTPAPLAASGTAAVPLLQTSGGQGGKTTAAGKKGGAGASISLLAGKGGDAVSGATTGDGGNISLQPGSPGADGSSSGKSGNVLIATDDPGFVGIGTADPKAKLTVSGVSSTGGVLEVFGAAPSFSSGTYAIGGHSTVGDGVRGITIGGRGVFGQGSTGVAGESTGSGDGVQGTSKDGRGVLGRSSTAIGVLGTSADALGGSSVSGIGVYGISLKGTGVKGESTSNYGVHGKAGGGKAAVFGEGVGRGVHGTSAGAGIGVFGENSGAGAGVSGSSQSGRGVFGSSVTAEGVKGTGATGVLGQSNSGTGVSGLSNTGYAGLFTGKARVTGNFEVGGNQFFGATTRQMINLYNQDYGIGIQASTLYFRTANTGGYNWYMGGVHNNTQNSPGTGGTSLMRLDSSGNLFVKGSVTATNVSNPSDRALKSNFSTVNPRAVLDRLAAVPVQTWNYKSEGETVRHMGPMAQDFKAAFDLGTDDKTISTVDSAGVTMAAVQGLYQLMLEKEKRNEELARTVERQGREIEQLRAELGQVRRAVRRGRAARR